MVLYSLQTYDQYLNLVKNGKITYDKEFIDDVIKDNCQLNKKPYYELLKRELVKKVNNFDGYPVFAWTNEDDARRYVLHSSESKQIVIVFEVPDEKVLLSDYVKSHQAKNFEYIPIDESDKNDFIAKVTELGFKNGKLMSGILNKNFDYVLTELIIPSFSRIFDISKSKLMQACVKEIDLMDVVQALPIEEFLVGKKDDKPIENTKQEVPRVI